MKNIKVTRLIGDSGDDNLKSWIHCEDGWSGFSDYHLKRSEHFYKVYESHLPCGTGRREELIEITHKILLGYKFENGFKVDRRKRCNFLEDCEQQAMI